MSQPFEKSVGKLVLVVEANESDLNRQCVRLSRSDNYNTIPLRLSLDELTDLQYLVNRAVETMRRLNG